MVIKDESTMITKSLVGLFSQGLTWPLEYAKTIKQFSECGNKNIYHIMKNDIKSNGLTNMYKSMFPQIISSVPRFITRFTVYEKLSKSDNKILRFGSGIIAGGVEAVLVMTPSETVKVQLVKNKDKYFFQTINNIYS